MVEYLPTRQFVRFRQFLLHGKRLGKELIDNMPPDLDGKQKYRDILSILGAYLYRYVVGGRLMLWVRISRGEQVYRSGEPAV